MTILPQLEQHLTDAARRRGRRALSPSWSRRPIAVLAAALALAAALVGFGLTGGSSRQFNVAAAVYRALTPGGGVQYIDIEEEARNGSSRSVRRFQRWRTADPRRERTVSMIGQSGGHARPLVLESTIAPGGTWSYWASSRPGVIVATSGREPARLLDETVVRSAYRSGALRLAGKQTVAGRALYRLDVVHPHSTTPPVELLVDAHSFVPVTLTQYARGAGSQLETRFVSRYRAYGELPLTPASLALLKMAAHPGVRVGVTQLP